MRQRRSIPLLLTPTLTPKSWQIQQTESPGGKQRGQTLRLRTIPIKPNRRRFSCKSRCQRRSLRLLLTLTLTPKSRKWRGKRKRTGEDSCVGVGVRVCGRGDPAPYSLHLLLHPNLGSFANGKSRWEARGQEAKGQTLQIRTIPIKPIRGRCLCRSRCKE